jgi:DNA-binding beta-propeller fold protein YncE
MEAVFSRALAKDPVERYDSCATFVADARRALDLEPKRTRWPLALASVGAVLIGAALLAFLLTREDGAVEPQASGKLVRIDPATNEIRASIAAGNGPNGVVAAGNDVWLTDRADGTLSRVDATTNQIVQRSSAHGSPADIAAGGGWIVVANGASEANVAAFEATTGTLDRLVNVASGITAPPQVAAGREGVWVATGDRRVQRVLSVRPAPRPTALPPPGDESADAAFSAIALGEGAVWVLGDLEDPRLWRLDSTSGKLTATITLPSAPKDVAVGEGAVWVTSQLDDTLTRIDPETGRITGTIDVGRGAAGVAVGAGAVWVANAVDGTVARIDPRRLTVVDTIDVGGLPNEIAVGPGGVWVASRG